MYQGMPKGECEKEREKDCEDEWKIPKKKENNKTKISKKSSSYLWLQQGSDCLLHVRKERDGAHIHIAIWHSLLSKIFLVTSASPSLQTSLSLQERWTYSFALLKNARERERERENEKLSVIYPSSLFSPFPSLSLSLFLSLSLSRPVPVLEYTSVSRMRMFTFCPWARTWSIPPLPMSYAHPSPPMIHCVTFVK